MQQSIQQWLGSAGYEAGKLLRSLRDKAEQWWYFLDHPEVSPDNNLAERSLRLAVTKRKVSGGSRAMERFAQTADLLTVVQTCRRQGRSGTLVFQGSVDGGVRQWEADSIPVASTNHLNPYTRVKRIWSGTDSLALHPDPLALTRSLDRSISACF